MSTCQHVYLSKQRQPKWRRLWRARWMSGSWGLLGCSAQRRGDSKQSGHQNTQSETWSFCHPSEKQWPNRSKACLKCIWYMTSVRKILQNDPTHHPIWERLPSQVPWEMSPSWKQPQTQLKVKHETQNCRKSGFICSSTPGTTCHLAAIHQKQLPWLENYSYDTSVCLVLAEPADSTEPLSRP